MPATQGVGQNKGFSRCMVQDDSQFLESRLEPEFARTGGHDWVPSFSCVEHMHGCNIVGSYPHLHVAH